MTHLEYAVLDVFAEKAFEGNQLAVFADGTGLSTEQMQTIAREMNLSETTFVLPRAIETERERGVRVRIFTTEEELPFAGHPTLGTATWVREHHPIFRGHTMIALECNAGRIPVEFAMPERDRPGIFGTMRQNDPMFMPVGGEGWPGRAELAEALGLEPDDLGLEGAEQVPAQVVSTGTPFCVVPLHSLASIGRLDVSLSRAHALKARLGTQFLYCVTRADRGGEAQWRARMQFYNGEDPATGSAAGCVAAWLVQHGLAESGSTVVLEQGVEMRRPSRLTLRATKTETGVTDVLVGGRTIPVATGRLSLP